MCLILCSSFYHLDILECQRIGDKSQHVLTKKMDIISRIVQLFGLKYGDSISLVFIWGGYFSEGMRVFLRYFISRDCPEQTLTSSGQPSLVAKHKDIFMSIMFTKS